MKRMVGAALRVTMVLTHPVQYFSPWFRYIAAHRPDVALTVIYAAIPTPAQQGEGFGRPFAWDVPLTEGYDFVVCGAADGMQFGSAHFFGVDVPDIGDRIASTNPDVVVVPGWHAAMQVRALRACRRLKVPVLYRGDSTLESGPSGVRRLLWRVKTRAMLRLFDGYLNVGAAAREYLRAFGVPEPLIASSPHAVDNHRMATEVDTRRRDGTRERLRRDIGAAPSDLVVLFAGKLQPIKRPIDAVRAVALAGPSVVLLVAGDGELADAVRAEAALVGVRVAMRGFVNQSEMPGMFAAADCLLLPSASETWGMVVNEALASGLPCIVTDRVGAARDLVAGGDGGWVVPVGDVEAMSGLLHAVHQARAEGDDVSRQCRARVAPFNFGAATDGLIAMSRRVLAMRRVPKPGRAAPRVIECCGNMVSVYGLERMTFEVLRALRHEGVQVHCIVNRWESSPIVELAEDIGASWSTGYYYYEIRRRKQTLLSVARVLWDIACTSGGLLRDAVRMRATHVALPEYGAALRNLPALVLLRWCGVRVILRLGNAPEEGRFYQKVWRWLVSPVVDVIVANSRFTQDALMAHGVPPRKIRMIYNAAPTRSLPVAGVAARDRLRVLYVGQLIPPKGAHLLLDAVAGLRAQGLPVTLDIVGNIDGWEPEAWVGYKAQLRARATEPDLQGHVRFLGVRRDVPALLAAAGLHCCPSLPEIREGFGVVTVEAKMAGVPSVVTASGALPELVEHGVDGWVCSEATVDAIMEGIRFFLGDGDRLDLASRSARASAGRFTRERFWSAWLEVFGVSPRSADVVLSATERAGP